MNQSTRSIKSFDWVVDSRTRLVILGSMPGVKSLEASRYYAHPRNLFWPFMDRLFGVDHRAPYQERLEALLGQGVGLWDVYSRCERAGSLDSNIVKQSAEVNDFKRLFTTFPSIQRLAFNGQASVKAFSTKVATADAKETYLKGKKLLSLPSTSPANAGISFEKKWQAWQVLKTL